MLVEYAHLETEKKVSASRVTCLVEMKCMVVEVLECDLDFSTDSLMNLDCMIRLGKLLLTLVSVL